VAEEIDEHPIGLRAAGGEVPVDEVRHAVLAEELDGVIAEAGVTAQLLPASLARLRALARVQATLFQRLFQPCELRQWLS
jgi:hypothetical protein